MRRLVTILVGASMLLAAAVPALAESDSPVVDENETQGEGEPCGGNVRPPLPACAEGLACKDTFSMGRARGIPGQCEAVYWCASEAMAEENCAGLVEPLVEGSFHCEESLCVWRPTVEGETQE